MLVFAALVTVAPSDFAADVPVRPLGTMHRGVPPNLTILVDSLCFHNALGGFDPFVVLTPLFLCLSQRSQHPPPFVAVVLLT